MEVVEFKNKLFDIISNSSNEISNYISLIYTYENQIKNYPQEENLTKSIIDNLLNYWIILQISILQWAIESVILLIENYIIKSNISITDLNQSIFSLIYNRDKDRIIKENIIYKIEIKTSKYKNFLDINNNENIILLRWTTNTIKYDNICEVFNLVWISIKDIINFININIDDLDKFYNKNHWSRYPIDWKIKNNFLKDIIDKTSNMRHLLVHWKLKELNNDKIFIYNNILIFREYIFNKFLNELLIQVKYFIENKKYLK